MYMFVHGAEKGGLFLDLKLETVGNMMGIHFK
jgi:hypothetical protein